MKRVEVIVVGGGHAGCEAASASARCGVETLLITLKKSDLGMMSCNPAIGGVGKGHLVREIDALGGLIGRVGDYAAIHYRLLNRRKGPAVQGPRTQADRRLYQRGMALHLSRQRNLSIVEAEVSALKLRNGAVHGVVLADGSQVEAPAVILTAGTFLKGVMFVGAKATTGGRQGAAACTNLADQLRTFDLPVGRLKTGTPPRLRWKSIAWDGLEKQPGDKTPSFLSFSTVSPVNRQIECAITRTNLQTHAIIRDNLAQSSQYGGVIGGVGPRYCPSIEDKVVRFATKESHQIFLEPEGLDSDVVYPNGISTSLPADIQELFVQSIQGLERAEIVRYGYAIEYDYFDPRSLSSSLGVKGISGLFFAGQINGTTGYEEAAAQGLVAGASAAGLGNGAGPLPLSRSNSYIGVMIDDLTMKGVQEPYRMFTSRSEYRLSLRPDNAELRLTGLGRQHGLVGAAAFAAFQRRRDLFQTGLDLSKRRYLSLSAQRALRMPPLRNGGRRSVFEALANVDIAFEDVLAADPGLASISPETGHQVKCQALYEPYLKRQAVEIAQIVRQEETALPDAVVYTGVSGLSNEIQGKLQRIRPKTLGQASRIEGMTPSALAIILVAIQLHAASAANDSA